MMKFRWIAVLVVMVMLGAVGSASAQMMMGGGMGMHGGDAKGAGHGGMMAGMKKDHHFLHLVFMLELTKEQEKDIEAIHFSHMKEAVRKKADMKVAEIELQEILVQEPVKMPEAEKKIGAIASFRADLEIMHLKEREAFKAILTPEQLEKLNKQLRADRHHMMVGKGDIGMHGSKGHGRFLTDSDDSDDDNDTGHETESDDDGKESKDH